MNEFVSWCRHLLVSFLFHALTSQHPPSFHRNGFSTCSTHFSFILVQSPEMFSLRRAHVDFMYIASRSHAFWRNALERLVPCCRNSCKTNQIAAFSRHVNRPPPPPPPFGRGAEKLFFRPALEKISAIT